MPDNSSRFTINGQPIHHFVSRKVLVVETIANFTCQLDGHFDVLAIHRCCRRIGCSRKP